MRVDIQPQWRKLASWYWDSLDGKAVHNRGMSIWEMLELEYNAVKLFSMQNVTNGMWVKFPDEKTYTAFLLRWS